MFYLNYFVCYINGTCKFLKKQLVFLEIKPLMVLLLFVLLFLVFKPTIEGAENH